jgi:hypothetical protein
MATIVDRAVGRLGILPLAAVLLLASSAGCYRSLDYSSIACDPADRTSCPPGYECRANLCTQTSSSQDATTGDMSGLGDVPQNTANIDGNSGRDGASGEVVETSGAPEIGDQPGTGGASAGTGGDGASGGGTGTGAGGAIGSGGVLGTGGITGSGGTIGPGTGGTLGLGGATSSGGQLGSGGVVSTGGIVGTGGTNSGGTTAAASFTITPSSSSLSTAVDVGTSGTQTATIVVTNIGGTTATPMITISNSSDFGVANGCTTAVNPSGTCILAVHLTPKGIGALSTTISVSPGAVGMNSATVTGVGRDQLALTVAVAGTGSGTISAPAGVEGNGISCPSDCGESYYRTTSNPTVTLDATYDSALTSVSWSAPCAGSSTSCTVTLTTAQSVTVTFTQKTYTVTVTRSAEATGATGSVSGSGISCGSTCTVTVNAGSTVALTAAPASGYYFSVWSGGGCSGGSLTCTSTAITANTTIDAKFTRANIIFATSTTYMVDQLAPNGGGNPQTGADNFCKTRATAGSASGLTGRTWVSLLTLGTGNSNPRAGVTRLGTKRGWVRPDGKPFGDTANSFLGSGNAVFYPPAVDENGTLITNGSSTTGASGDGCVGWTSNLMADYRAGGVPTAGGAGWIEAYGMPCAYDLRLYCMSIDYTATVPPPGRTTASRIGFLSDGLFTPAGSAGISAADAVCAADAATASFSGTFKAFLATPTASALSRFASSGPWVRPDGVSIGTVAQLSASTVRLDAPIDQLSSGGYMGLVGPWTGANSPSAVGTPEWTCTPSGGSPWTSGASATIGGQVGLDWNTDNGFFYDASTYQCDQPNRVYCLQQ